MCAIATRYDKTARNFLVGIVSRSQSPRCAARRMGGVRHAVLLPMREWLLARMAETPKLTVRAVEGEFRELGHAVSEDAVWRFLRVGVSRGPRASPPEKTPHTAELVRPDVARKRERRLRHQRRIDPRRLVFAWAKTDMTCTRGGRAKAIG